MEPPDNGNGRFTLRTATAADAAGVLSIYAPFVSDGTVSFEQHVPSIEEMAARISRTLIQFPYYVAESGGKVVGYAYATAYRSRAAYQWGTEVSVYVDPSYQRGGIGRVLYERLIETLLRQGYVNLYAGITLPNDASVAFHEALGFSRFAVYEGVGYKMGEWRDVGWWVRFASQRPETPEPPIPFPEVHPDDA